MIFLLKIVIFCMLDGIVIFFGLFGRELLSLSG